MAPSRLARSTSTSPVALHPVALHVGNQQAVVDPRHFQISPRGMVFRSNAALPTWTEVSISVHLPNGQGRAPEQVDCQGVVINCRRQRGGGWKCAVVFLDLSKKTEAQFVTKICPAVRVPSRSARNHSPRNNSLSLALA